MILLATLVHDVGLNLGGPALRREAVRAIVMRGRKLLLLLSPAAGDYKFPGGGVEAGETDAAALARELREECGLRAIQVLAEFGQVVEHARPIEPGYAVFSMTSRYYLCEATGPAGAQQLDAYERALGLLPVWVDIDQAIRANSAALRGGERAARWVRRETLVLEQISRRMLGG